MTNAEDPRTHAITVYVGLGSNLGDRKANLEKAVRRIEELGLDITKRSSIYETEPVGYRDQQWFLNQVFEASIPDAVTSFGRRFTDVDVKATYQAEAFLTELLKIERAIGRDRTIAGGPRIIDLDLLLFGDMIIAHTKAEGEWSFADRSDIVVPHPRMHRRRFVLEPLCEIAPEVVHPVLKKTCRELLAELDDHSRVWIHDKKSAESPLPVDRPTDRKYN